MGYRITIHVRDIKALSAKTECRLGIADVDSGFVIGYEKCTLASVQEKMENMLTVFPSQIEDFKAKEAERVEKEKHEIAKKAAEKKQEKSATKKASEEKPKAGEPAQPPATPPQSPPSVSDDQPGLPLSDEPKQEINPTDEWE